MTDKPGLYDALAIHRVEADAYVTPTDPVPMTVYVEDGLVHVPWRDRSGNKYGWVYVRVSDVVAATALSEKRPPAGD